MNLDTLIREADPAPLRNVPGPDSPFGRAIAQRVRRDTLVRIARPSRRRPIAVVVSICGIAAVGVLVAAVVPGSPARPTSAAAAVLADAASAAAGAPPLALGSGQYLYTETKTMVSSGYLDLTKAGQIQVTWTLDEQLWEASDGSGREVDHNIGPVTFQTPRSEANWEAAGSPPKILWLPPYTSDATTTVVDTTLTPATSGATNTEGTSMEPGVKPFDVSALPTDPTALEEVIGEGKTGDVELASPGAPLSSDSASRASYIFGSAAALLGTPETGTSPQLRQALFQVMADQPGITLLGTMTDRDGRSGTGIAGPEQLGLRYELIVDPTTGDLLQLEQVVVDPTAETPGIETYFGSSPGQVLGWTEYLGSGIADSTTATSSAPGVTAS